MNEKILIVDDSYFNIKILTDILKYENFMVFSTNNGFSIIDMVRNIKPDVILLDIIMPKLDGFQICKLLHSEYDLKDIPIIMVTEKTKGTDIRNALELGAFDYIKRPIDEIEVIARIKSALRFKKQHNKLKELATKDSLTGLYNHGLLVELFKKELAKHKRNNNNLSFVMIDIDYFKKVNDTYGHMSGDIILKEVSNILTNSVRKSDIVARYGGEEFGIVLPEIEKQDTFNLCERIRKKIENYNFHIGNETIKITVSIGVFFKDSKNNITCNEIIQKTDEKLYSAKHNGRNRVEIN